MNRKSKRRKPCKALSGALSITMLAVSMTVLTSFGGCAYKIVKVKHPLIEDMRETLPGDVLLKKDGSKQQLTRGYCVTDQWLIDTAGMEVE